MEALCMSFCSKHIAEKLLKGFRLNSALRICIKPSRDRYNFVGYAVLAWGDFSQNFVMVNNMGFPNTGNKQKNESEQKRGN
jgi:hypothetical protein